LTAEAFLEAVAATAFLALPGADLAGVLAGVLEADFLADYLLLGVLFVMVVMILASFPFRDKDVLLLRLLALDLAALEEAPAFSNIRLAYVYSLASAMACLMDFVLTGAPFSSLSIMSAIDRVLVWVRLENL